MGSVFVDGLEHESSGIVVDLALCGSLGHREDPLSSARRLRHAPVFSPQRSSERPAVRVTGGAQC